MVYLGLEPGAAGWQAQRNPLSYGGTHVRICSLLNYVPLVSSYCQSQLKKQILVTAQTHSYVLLKIQKSSFRVKTLKVRRILFDVDRLHNLHNSRYIDSHYLTYQTSYLPTQQHTVLPSNLLIYPPTNKPIDTPSYQLTYGPLTYL